MLEPEYLEELPKALLELYYQAETDILCDMARRISTYDYWIPSAEHQRQKLLEMGMIHEDIIKELAGITGKSDKELKKLMEEAGIKTIKSDNKIYEKAGLNPSPIQASKELKDILNAGYKYTKKTFKNLTKTTANTATKQFENALDRAWMQIQSGGFDYNTAIRNAIKDLSEQGIGAVIYPSGHRDTIETAVRRAVVTGVNKSCADVQLARLEEMGTDLVEVSAHAGARPEHAEWQGKVYSYSGETSRYPDFLSSTGYGTGAGLCGWNCRHNFRPYIEGSPRTYSKELLDSYNEKKYEYNGKSLTEYEASQIQRKIERNIRRWKREEAAMKTAGLPAAEASAKIGLWSGRQKDFLDKTDLKRQRDRESVSKNSYIPLKNRDIIKLNEESEIAISKMEFSALVDYKGKLSNRAVRRWYLHQDSLIPERIDRRLSLEEQAKQAFEMRNINRSHARDLMRDQELRKKLDINDPNKSFEELIEDKMSRKGMSREEAVKDILKTATKTRKSVNRKFGLENK